MAIPASGAVSMNDMNVEITRASATATLAMGTIRTRYGGSGAISFSDLRKSEGFTVTCGTITSKFVSLDGYFPAGSPPVGSVSPNESNSFVQFAANSYLSLMASGNGTDDQASIGIMSDNNFGSAGVTTGFKATNITRVVTANTSRTLGWAVADDNTAYFTYNFPTSGTIHCLVKF
jgi:hypothetical protein